MTPTQKSLTLSRIRAFKNSLSQMQRSAQDYGNRWDQGQWSIHYQKVREIKSLIASENRKIPLY